MATAIRKLIVEIVDAQNLLPIDGKGTSSPYVVVDFYGQRKRTHTAIRTLTPTWNEVLEFSVGKPSNVLGDMLEIDMFHDRTYGPTRRNNFLGRIRLSSAQFVKKGEEALIYFPLQKKNLFSWIRGEIGLKIYYLDEVVPPELPPEMPEPPPPTEEVKPEPDSEPKQPAENATAESSQVELEDKQLDQAPADDSKNLNEEPPAQPEVEITAESDPPPQPNEEVVTDQVKPDPPEPPSFKSDEDHIEIVPPSNFNKSAPEVKFSGINGPQPIKRPMSGSNYMLEPTESLPIERSAFDLVEKMHYVFVQVVKARSLPTNGSPVARIVVGGHRIVSKPSRKTDHNVFEWGQTFAFGREMPDDHQSSTSILEVSMWDPEPGRKFLGRLCFDVSEFPLRDPPDSPLAPQWYKLEDSRAQNDYIMLAMWIGTQADEAFPDAWKTDTANHVGCRAKVYQSPKLWYLRAQVIEAQNIMPLTSTRDLASFQVKVQLGFQVSKTKVSITQNGAPPSWNEDLIFVASEPFSDQLTFTLENRQSKGPVTLGVAMIPLVEIERRVDERKVTSRWITLENHQAEKAINKGRLHLRLCFDGGYHVMDEAAYVCSDYRPTARQLWKPPVGTVELGIIGCKSLLPVKMVDGKGCTDAYCVAKYGPKWVRTRTVSDSLDPKWNEQYTWKVYDPCTVLTLGIFDSSGVNEIDGSKDPNRPDFRIGKVRVRISTLEIGKVYRNIYPLLVLSNTGMRKMGEVEMAIRFVRATPALDFIHVYSQPLLPLMHHIKPLAVVQQEMLRTTAVKIVAAHLSRSEPPIRREVVQYMLDVDSHTFSMRKVRANWFRIINVLAGLIDVVNWVEQTRSWKKPTATILVHALLVMLVWFPDLIVPTLAFYIFAIGAWNYRFRSHVTLPHFDPKLSLIDTVDRDELDEEFDIMPSSRPGEVVRARYDRLRTFGARVQTVLGDFATLCERVQALVTWRDPRATGIFVGLCFVVAMILCMVPSKTVAVAFGFYYLRHPIFRDRMPSPVLNFFRRLPSLSDRIM